MRNLPYFKGGKIDAFYDRKDNDDFQVNSILWMPVFKGGHGVQISETGRQDINYFGGFVRPLLLRPELGGLVLGAQEVLQGDSKQTEVQDEYRLPFGLGLGGVDLLVGISASRILNSPKFFTGTNGSH